VEVLAGDIGGSNARLALVRVFGERTEIVQTAIYPSQAHDGLDEIVRLFVKGDRIEFDVVSIGVPGPVRKGRAKTTNLPWIVDRDRLQTSLGVPTLVLNDLEAAAWSLSSPADDHLEVILEGDPAEGNRALISPGTGLGEAGLFWDGRQHHPFASEGGHGDFAPADELERALLVELSERYDHVSWERLVSGPGLVALHEFLCRREGRSPTSCAVSELEDHREAAPAITRGARDGSCEICAASLERFCELLAAEAGNLALKMLAMGGLFIGGGIAPDILPELRKGAFESRFTAKGRMSELVASMPVYVILDEAASLRGAARAASRLSG
jgi:glucokinase